MSSSRRCASLLSGLLFLALPALRAVAGEPVTQTPAPLPDRSALQLKVTQGEHGDWIANIDYSYNGTSQNATLWLQMLPRMLDPSGTPGIGRLVTQAAPGTHHLTFGLSPPGLAGTTRQVMLQLIDMASGTTLASTQTDVIIDWPDAETYYKQMQVARETPEQTLKRAVDMVDAGRVNEARPILEQLINRNPRVDAAYIELARIAMKSNWSAEGLHQAESLLSSAMQINPDSVNAMILLGYVYTHQKRYDKAEALFASAARSNPPNLWLWANWGELLLMQHKDEAAIAKYRLAIAHPMTHDTNDRARADAYDHLLALLEQRKDADGMEALYKQRVEEFGPGACYSAPYARFMLQVRGDAQSAIDIARRALNQNCEDQPAREVLGLAQYVKWAASTGAERDAALNQARIYLPAGPMPLYLLATSDRTSSTIKQLVAAGEQIDEKDSEDNTALGYALQKSDLAAARRLLKSGARPETPVGFEGIPLALVPVEEGNIDAVRLLREFGVDYSKLRFRGATAIDFAKQSGNDELLRAVGQGRSEL